MSVAAIFNYNLSKKYLYTSCGNIECMGVHNHVRSYAMRKLVDKYVFMKYLYTSYTHAFLRCISMKNERIILQNKISSTYTHPLILRRLNV
jgi:hypothetical protein